MAIFDLKSSGKKTNNAPKIHIPKKYRAFNSNNFINSANQFIKSPHHQQMVSDSALFIKGYIQIHLVFGISVDLNGIGWKTGLSSSLVSRWWILTELQRIEILDVMINLHTSNCLTGLATKHYLNQQFYGRTDAEKKLMFKTNVANTFGYKANSALIESSVVGIVEHFKSEDKLQKLNLDVPDIEELRKHRIVISHPANVNFTDQKVQQFYDADLHYKDSKALRVLRVRDAVIAKLRELGSARVYPNKVTIQLGTVELSHGALLASLKDGNIPTSIPEMANAVKAYFEEYEQALCRFAYPEA